MHMARSPLDIPQALLDALDAAVSGAAAIRQQIGSLQAAEALCLAAGSAIAEAIANEGSHPDHGDMAHRMVAADFGAAMRESDRTVATRMQRATTLTEDYPGVYSSLAAGRISAAHATVIVEAGNVILHSAGRAEYAQTVLEYAESESVGRLRPVAKELAERFAERTLDERHEAARACRMVRVEEREDGMADLIATLPALLAYGIKDRLDQVAHHIKSAGSAGRSGFDTRKIDEIRADLLTDMLLASDLSELARMEATGVASIRARVQVVVPESRLGDAMGDELKGEPAAALAGYGPIDSEAARLIAGFTPSWQRVRVEAESGNVISVDSYRPNAKLRRFLGARDQHCRFPACRMPLRKCDIDHTIDAAMGGPTTSTNTAHTCRRHHTMKHATPWRVTQDQTGVLHWVSPTGRSHHDRPSSRVRFRSTPGSGSGSGSGPGSDDADNANSAANDGSETTSRASEAA